MKPIFSTIGKFINWLTTLVQGIGTFALGVFFILFVILLVNLPGPAPIPSVPTGAVLVLNPRGVVMEQVPVTKPLTSTSLLGGERERAESVHDILRAIRLAKSDTRISGLAINTNGFAGAGSALLYEMADAIRDFKTSEKPVYAIAAAYSQSSYLLAAEADKIYLDGEGSVLLSGYGIFPMYYKELFDKIEATVEVFRVGTYKSAVEPYTRDSMSDEVRLSNGELINGLWSDYTNRIAAARATMTADDVNASVADIVSRLRAAGGDFATMAENNGFVDAIATPNDMNSELAEIHGKSAESFLQINHRDYLAAIGPDTGWGDEIAIITAQGVIVPGGGPASVAASGTIANYIKQARSNPNTKAIVLRVDSPGGSAFASERIRQELVAAQNEGLPVIASFGSVAASGGYWIAASSDRIFASPTSVTGSIGIFAVLTTFENTAKKVGVSVDGVATSELASGLNPFKGLNTTVRDVLQLSIEDGYQDFLTLVSENRGMTMEEADQVGQGRVWLGKKAHELGLVDELGSFEDAVKYAAETAEIGDDYTVNFYREELDPFDAYLIELLDDMAYTDKGATINSGEVETSLTRSNSIWSNLLQAAQTVEQDFTISDPNGRLIICMVCRPE